MRLRENPKIVFVSIDRKILELLWVFLAAFVAILSDSVLTLTGTSEYQLVEEIFIQSNSPGSITGDSVNNIGAKVSLWCQWVSLLLKL